MGRQSEETYYVDGFMDAALELVSAVIDKDLSGKRDTLVMPILFNARHAVELSLKHAIRVLAAIGVLAGRHPENHDISSHWAWLRAGQLGDVVLRETIEALEPFVASLAAVDEDGQSLRYPTRRDGQTSLGDRALANLQVIRASLTALQELLKALKFRVLDLVDERGSGTFTPACSRQDLFQITSMLPQRSDWASSDFDEAKAEIRARFQLGNAQFSRALNVIQAHRRMGAMLGRTFELTYLTDAHAVFAIEQWLTGHPPQPSKPRLPLGIIAARDISFEEMARDHELATAATKAIITTLSPDEIADLEAIYQLGRVSDWPENYPTRLETACRANELTDDLSEKVAYLVNKGNLQGALADGAAILGRPRLADALRALGPTA